MSIDDSHDESPAEQILNAQHIRDQNLVPRKAGEPDTSFVGKSITELPSIKSEDVRPGQAVAILTERGSKWVLVPESQGRTFFKRPSHLFTVYGDYIQKFFGLNKLEHVGLHGSSPGGGDKSIQTGVITQHAVLEMGVPLTQLGPLVLDQMKNVNLIIETEQIRSAGVFSMEGRSNPHDVLTPIDRTTHSDRHWNPTDEWRKFANMSLPIISEQQVAGTVSELVWRGYYLGPGDGADRVMSKHGKPIHGVEYAAQFADNYLSEFNQKHSENSLRRAAAIVWWAGRLDRHSPPVHLDNA